MNASDYIDWWQRTGMNAGPADERYGQLRQHLSLAGGNVVLVWEFLQTNPDVIDPGYWMPAQGFLPQGSAVRFVADARAAVGAHRTAALLRQLQPPAPALPDPAEFLKGQAIDPQAIRKAAQQLRDRLLAKMPDLANDLPPEVRAQLPPPRQAEGADTRAEIAVLLERYVAAQQAKLAADLARHARLNKSQPAGHTALFREQRDRVPALAEKLQRLTKRIQSEPPASPALQHDRQKVLEEYRRYAGEPSEKVAPEVRAWLQDVDRLRQDHPDAFRPRATADERINAQLAAIGAYEVDFRDRSPTVTWSDLPELRYDWAAFSLAFTGMTREKKPAAAAVARAYDALFTTWERFRQRFPRLEPEVRQYLVDCYQSGDFAEEAPNEAGPAALTDREVLEGVEGGCVHLVYSDNGGVQQVLAITARWAPRGVEVRFDPNGEIEWDF